VGGLFLKCRVVFADTKVKESFKKLKDSKTEGKKLYVRLNIAFDDISENTFCGIQIPKKMIPKKYLKEYEIDNLWRYNLPGAWRLLYSVARDEVIVLAIVLEWLPHKEYEKRFGY
jgi:mRNA-degrading endonuclease RelE of RelBE toxin-antitoxin system